MSAWDLAADSGSDANHEGPLLNGPNLPYISTVGAATRNESEAIRFIMTKTPSPAGPAIMADFSTALPLPDLLRP